MDWDMDRFNRKLVRFNRNFLGKADELKNMDGDEYNNDIISKYIQASRHRLRWRRNKEFLWISIENKGIYLYEQKACLLMFFSNYDDMEKYIEMLIKKGYKFADIDNRSI